MYDPTFNSETLAWHLNAHDIQAFPLLNDDKQKELHITQAVALARNGFGSISLQIHKLRGASIYRSTSIQEDLVLRKAQQNLRRITNVRQSDRMEIIRCIKSLCREGVPYKVYKIDIKKFYESVDTAALAKNLERDIPTSPSSLLVLGTFFEALKIRGIAGLPRGLSISATLSEYLMRRFDEIATRTDGVHFYARYVDDMLIITKGDENPKTFIRNLSRKLPSGLKFNYSKTRFYNFLPYDKSITGTVENSFDFLGYQFSVYVVKNQSGSYERPITLDIAPKKIKRAKTRLVLAFRQFMSDGNFADLEDRIRVLTGNYSFFDHRKRVQRLAGVYYSYRLIDETSRGLNDLDQFLRV